MQGMMTCGSSALQTALVDIKHKRRAAVRSLEGGCRPAFVRSLSSVYHATRDTKHSLLRRTSLPRASCPYPRCSGKRCSAGIAYILRRQGRTEIHNTEGLLL